MILILIIVVLLIYSVLATYHYFREKKRSRSRSEYIEDDLDIKIDDVRKRLNKIRRESRSIDNIELKDEDEI